MLNSAALILATTVTVLCPSPAEQSAIESQLRQRLQPFQSADDVAAKLGNTAPEIDPEAAYAEFRERADSLLGEASAAYYESRTGYALERLGALAALQDAAPLYPIKERSRLLLWRTAAYLALDNREQAMAEARKALVLDPELVVDTAEFRPSVAVLVETVRKEQPTLVKITLRGHPNNAKIAIDDRPGKTVMKVPKGEHRIIVSAPGWTPVVKWVDARVDAPVRISMTPALTDEQWRTIEALPSAGSIPAQLPALMDALGTDILVTGTRREITAASRTEIMRGATAVTRLIEKLEAQPPPRVPQEPIAVGYGASAAAAWISHTRTIEGTDGNSFGVTLTGGGTRVAIESGWGPILLEVDGAWFTFGASSLLVNVNGEPQQTVPGGTLQQFAARAAYRHRRSETVEVTAGIGASLEDYFGTDVVVGNIATGLAPSYRQIAGGVFGRTVIDFGRVQTSVGLGLNVLSSFTERPAGATGTDAALLGPLSWRIGAVWQPVKRWSVAAEYAGEVRRVRYLGEAMAPVRPVFRDTQQNDLRHIALLSVRFGT